MFSTSSLDLNIKVVHHISEVDEAVWDDLSGKMPFQSYRWYQFGEQVMTDCQPFYLLAFKESQLVGRAALWKIHNEPLPKMPALLRRFLLALFRISPLLICRSPLAFTHGIAIANGFDPSPILSALSDSALEIAREKRCSLVLFDYLRTSDVGEFPQKFLKSSNPSSGTIMENRWSSLEDFLSAGNKKDRQHYKRTMRNAEMLNIQIKHHTRVENIEEALDLIRNVERMHGALPNPWARRMLEQMTKVNGLYLTATIGERLVGCGLLLEDNASQINLLLGLAEDVPYVYFVLIYESLKVAFEHEIRFLRWGSGAYEVKERFRFLREDNGALALSATSSFLQRLLQRFV